MLEGDPEDIPDELIFASRVMTVVSPYLSLVAEKHLFKSESSLLKIIFGSSVVLCPVTSGMVV